MFHKRKPVAKDEQVNLGDGIPHQKLSFDTTLLEAAKTLASQPGYFSNLATNICLTAPVLATLPKL